MAGDFEAGEAVGVAVAEEPARFAEVDRGAGNGREDRVVEDGEPAGRAVQGRQLGVDRGADGEATLTLIDREDDRGALDGDDLADQAGKVGDRA